MYRKPLFHPRAILIMVLIASSLMAACSPQLPPVNQAKPLAVTATLPEIPPNATATTSPIETPTSVPPTSTPTKLPTTTSTATLEPSPTVPPLPITCADLDYARTFAEEKAQQAGYTSMAAALLEWASQDEYLSFKLATSTGDALLSMQGKTGDEQIGILLIDGFSVGSYPVAVPVGSTPWGYSYEAFTGLCLVQVLPMVRDDKLDYLVLPLLVEAQGGENIQFKSAVIDSQGTSVDIEALSFGAHHFFDLNIYRSPEKQEEDLTFDASLPEDQKIGPFLSVIGPHLAYLSDPVNREAELGFAGFSPESIAETLQMLNALTGGQVSPYGWAVWQLFDIPASSLLP